MNEKMIMSNKVKTFMTLLSGIIIALAVILFGGGSAWAADVSDQTGLEAALSGTDSVITLTGNITLTKDITVSRTVTFSGGSITLNTAGYSLIVALGGNLTVNGDLTITGSGEQTIKVQNAGTFTLSRGNVTSASGSTWHSAIYIDGGGTVNINGGTVVSNDDRSEGALYANGGIVTVNVSGGEITGYSHGIKLFYGDPTSSRSAVTVSGGTITATAPETAAQAYGVRVEKGNVTIDGDAEISALFSVSVNVGSLDISGGTINGSLSLDTCPIVIGGGTVNGDISITDAGTVTFTGGAINGQTDLNNCGTVEISGGTFTNSGPAISLSSIGNVTISGGTFRGSVGVNIYSIDSGKSVSICGDADITGTDYGVYGSSGTVTISGQDVAISGGYGLYVANGCTVAVSGGTITGSSYGGIFINGGALTLTGGTIINSRKEAGYYGIYIQTGPANNRITSAKELSINANAPLFYKVSSCFDSLPGPQTLAAGETKAVTLAGFDTSTFEYTVDTTNTSAKLNAGKTSATTFSMAPTAAGNYNLVLSGRKSGETAFLTLTVPVSVVYSLTYDANGGTGAAPAKIYIDEGETFTAAAANSFTPPSGKQFKEWNTLANGAGTKHLAEAPVTMPANNLTLYAIWEDIPVTYTAGISPTSKTFTAATAGYSQQTAQEFTITNTGTGAITGLSAALASGTSFEISTALSADSLNAADTAALSVRPKTGLAANTYADTLAITGDNGISLTVSLSFTVHPDAAYGISLDKTGTHTFAGQTAGYASLIPLTVTVSNTGNQATGDLTAALSGMNPGSYTLSKTTIGSIAVSGSDTFTVAPDIGLSAGTYTATVKVSGSSNITEQVFTVSFTVDPAPVTTYTVTFNNNGSTYAAKTVNAGASIGSAAWPADPARSGYTFGGWFKGENGAGVRFTAATAVNAAMTVYAKWTYSGGGGGNGGDGGGGGGGSTLSTPAAPTYNADIKAGSGTPATLPVTVDKNSGIARMDMGSQKLISGRTVITIPPIPDVDTYSVGIPVSVLSTAGKEGSLTVETHIGSITVPSNMLTGASGINGSKAEISIGKGDKENLPDDVKSAIGDKPLIQLTLSIDGKQTDWSNPGAPVTVSIPYTPTAAELANPESIVVWYIDGSGNAVSVPNGHYDPATGMVTFDTTHFSDYAVAYNKVSFNDVAAGAWYNKAVGFIAARGITYGTGNGNFSPEAKLTRGQFIVMLMKAYGIAPDANSTDNFADAGNTYYTGYLAAAKRLRISAGVGNNLFAPEKDITRQETFTLLYNALRVIGQLPGGDSGKTLDQFTDAGQIDAWAKEAMTLLVKTDTVGGYNGQLTPQGTTTRAEMAQVLYSLLGK